MGWQLNGNGPRRILIGFEGAKPHLVRADNGYGDAVAVSYFAPNHVVGPAYEPPQLGELVKVLKGANQTRRLEALVWLAGCHHRVSDHNPNVVYESPLEETRYAEAIMAKSVAEIITKLRRSANPCERELAQSVPIGVGLFDPYRF